jgi:glycosyltransferase involved in cell wall biosynthesis
MYDSNNPGESLMNRNSSGALLPTRNEPEVSAEDSAAKQAANQDSQPLSGKRVSVVLYSTYPSDPRPRRAAEALSRAGAIVEVICLEETDDEPRHEIISQVSITRISLKHHRGGKLSYVLQYAWFILLASAIMAGRSLNRRYDLVHVHNMPDILAFSAIVPKLFGAKVILDLHDPMPELMMTIFGLRERSYLVRLLKMFEKLSIGFADAVLTTNEAFRKLFSARSCPPQKISVVMNSPDEDIFRYRPASGQDSMPRDTSRPFVIMYHGTLVERYGLDLAVRALAKIRKTVRRAELRIYGRSTPFLEGILDDVLGSELAEAVQYLGPMKLEQISLAIRNCDVGVVPNRRCQFTELNMPTRIFEYLSQGKPAIAPGSPGIRDYFGPESLILFELGDVDDLAEKLEYVFAHPAEVAKIVARGQEAYRAHQWRGERLRLISLVEQLLNRHEPLDWQMPKQKAPL